MILAYVFTFIALFSLFSMTFHQKYRNLFINEKYFYESYDPYVHRKSHSHLVGFNLRHLMDPSDNFWKPYFIETIQAAYSKTEFGYESLGEDLLQFFQKHLTTSQAIAKENEKYYIEKSSDLNQIAESLAEKDDLLFKLLHRSKIHPDDDVGYLSLIDLLHPTLPTKDCRFDLYALPSEIIEGILGPKYAESFKAMKEAYKIKESQEKENLSEVFYEEFMSVHRLPSSHPTQALLFHPWTRSHHTQ